jgi:N6-adenosine-specific RNA methylase IME4
MTELTRLEPAFRELADAKDLTSVKDIRDKAASLEGYAREARDSELMDHAVQVRLNAERKAGQLLIEMAERGERAKPGDAGGGTDGQGVRLSVPPTLTALGLTKYQSSLWQRLAELDEEEFQERLSQARHVAWASIELTPAERLWEKRERRNQRERDTAAKILALPDKRYGVILADPEWRFEPYSRETGMDRAADNHYSTSPTDVIKARDVASIAAEDCVLFLWATVPMLPEALKVQATWGFAYRSHFIWVKDSIGTGYWNRNRHELLLVGVRGDVPAPAMGTQFDSAIAAPVGAHSEKPDFAYDIIERHFPTLPKIELNARERRQGWDAWGDEAPEDEAAA